MFPNASESQDREISSPPAAVQFPRSVLAIDAKSLVSESDGAPFDWKLVGSAGGLTGQLFDQRNRSPSSVAIATRSEVITYGQLLSAIVRVARSLRANPHFSSGSRIVLLAPNSIEYVMGFYGILLAGGVVVPVAHTRENHELQQIMSATEATVAMTSTQIRRLPACLHATSLFTLGLHPPAAVPVKDDFPLLGSENDLAAIFFTAGSTGCPKGVMLSHRNLIANASSIQQYLSISSTDRPLCVLPFHHAYGNSILQSHLLAGATLILDGKPMFPETLVEAIQHHRATSLSVVPDLVRMLIDHTSLGKLELPSLRYLTVAGGSLRHDLALTLASRAAPAELYLMYGQTEATARLAYVPPDQLTKISPGCIGRPIPGVELKIVDDQECEVRPGEVGELRARGDNVMLGYWNDATGTAETIRDGWLATGDLASIDSHGWIYHQGRRSALVKIAGYRVHPAVLEDFAMRRFPIAEAAAVPYESPQVGTRLALFVRHGAPGPLDQSEMLSLCHSELPRHLVPGMIRVLDDFPLNSALKLDRLHLTRLAEDACRSRHQISNPSETTLKDRE